MPEFDDARLIRPAGSGNVPLQVSAGVAALRDAPRGDAQMVTQALYGESITLLREDGGFGLVQLARDRYVGWAELEALSSPVASATHRVAALRTHLYSEPDLKSAPHFIASMGSLVSLSGEEGAFLKTSRGGWVPTQHIALLDTFEDDPADVAIRFLNAPYLWGGRESLGLDCTGLTQTAFGACGVVLPRDSDMQFAWAGSAVTDWQAPGGLQRNDLVFWRGHVGIMLDASTLLHANAYHMAVVAEPLDGAIERIKNQYGEPVGARRMDIMEERRRKPDWLAA